MKNEVHVTDLNQRRQSDANKFMTPENRKRIRQLKRQLDNCNQELSWHLSLFQDILEALDTARQTAECLLADDPFEAWVKMTNATAEKFHTSCAATSTKGSSTAVRRAGQVGKLISRNMQQQVVDAETRLDNYANCLESFFYELTTLESFDAAVELAEELQFNEPLQTREAQK